MLEKGNLLHQKYTIVDVIGEGGFGIVYKAKVNTEHFVAIKVSKSNSGSQDKFRKEIAALRDLKHPNLVQMEDSEENGPEIWYAMEYLEGPSLGDWLFRKPKLGEIVQCFQQIADAIDALHKKSIVHRDIKPQNIIMRSTGKISPVIVDLGLAYNPARQYGTMGAVQGTILYMSPEQLDGNAHDLRVDIWAVGVMLYQALTFGQHPYLHTKDESSSLYSMEMAIKENSYQDPSQYTPELKTLDGLLKICKKALQKDKDKRYETIAAFRDDLAKFYLEWIQQNFTMWKNKAQKQQAEAAQLAQQAQESLNVDSKKQAIAAYREAIQCWEQAYTWSPQADEEILPKLKECWLKVYADLCPPYIIHVNPEGQPIEPTWKKLETRRLENEESSPALEQYYVWKELTYGLPIQIWEKCRYKHEDEWVLDMSTEAWQKLSLSEQAEYAGKYQAGYAKAKQLALEIIVDPDRAKMKAILIPPGRFFMGSPMSEKGRRENETQHLVMISKPYYMGKTSITQAQWEAVMETNPSYFKNGQKEMPVEQVNWDECVQFCQILGTKLPTEAQWEFASRAGIQTASNCENDAFKLGDCAWYDDNSENHPHPVAQKQPNAFQLHDILGNIVEWCHDAYAQYPSSHVIDPCHETGSHRIGRGGSWYDGMRKTRFAFRCRINPNERINSLGFRIVMD